MKIIFFDKRKETFRSVSGVEQVSTGRIKTNGRYVNHWILTLKEGGTMTFKQRDFEINRVETEGGRACLM